MLPLMEPAEWRAPPSIMEPLRESAEPHEAEVTPSPALRDAMSLTEPPAAPCQQTRRAHALTAHVPGPKQLLFPSIPVHVISGSATSSLLNRVRKSSGKRDVLLKGRECALTEKTTLDAKRALAHMLHADQMTIKQRQWGRRFMFV